MPIEVSALRACVLAQERLMPATSPGQGCMSVNCSYMQSVLICSVLVLIHLLAQFQCLQPVQALGGCFPRPSASVAAGVGGCRHGPGQHGHAVERRSGFHGLHTPLWRKLYYCWNAAICWPRWAMCILLGDMWYCCAALRPHQRCKHVEAIVGSNTAAQVLLFSPWATSSGRVPLLSLVGRRLLPQHRP